MARPTATAHAHAHAERALVMKYGRHAVESPGFDGVSTEIHRDRTVLTAVGNARAHNTAHTTQNPLQK
jgi:hypothetical protein